MLRKPSSQTMLANIAQGYRIRTQVVRALTTPHYRRQHSASMFSPQPFESLRYESGESAPDPVVRIRVLPLHSDPV
jgi:hypothetical protein